MKIMRIAAVAVAPLALQGCMLTPAEFASTMDVRADRGFTFTYVGTVRAIDLAQIGDELGRQMGQAGEKDIEDFEPTTTALSFQDAGGAGTADSSSGQSRSDPGDKPASEGRPDPTNPFEAFRPLSTEESKRELAATLAKEKGFRRISYRGDNLYDVDYAISGRLDHGFSWPVNLDAEQVMPFIAAEVRANGAVRIKAPGYAKSSQRADLAALLPERDGIKGRFTIISDAPIIATNQEDGASRIGTRNSVSWTITSMTAEPPSATIALAP